MDREAWPPEKLMSCLSYRPLHILEGMITISEPAQRSAIRRHSNSSPTSSGMAGVIYSIKVVGEFLVPQIPPMFLTMAFH